MEPIKIGYTVDDLVAEILRKKIKKIVVMAGAGISTPSGIPDFRSPGSGLYSNLDNFDIPYPEAIFEISYFRQNPKPFFTLAKDLIPNIEKYKPNKIHYFIKLLQEKRLLHRLYTQNIDGLECLAGIDHKKIIEAHGSFRSAKCLNCKTPYSGLYVKNEVFKDNIPRCKYGSCTGVIKPDIVFFGDKLPDNFYAHHENDFQTADCIIVMGTSLEVEPFANIIRGSHFNAPRLLMNRESVGPFKRGKRLDKRKDLQLLGDLVNTIDDFVDKLGWTKDFELLVEKEMNNIEENSHSTLEKLFYRVFREKNLIKNKNERISKTSFDKRERIDSSKRKTVMDINQKSPLVKTFMRANDHNITSKLMLNRKKNLKIEENSKIKNENEMIRAIYQDIETLSLTNSISDEEEETKDKEKPKSIIPYKANLGQKSDFLQRNYDFQLKLAFNFNQIPSLETKNLDSNLSLQKKIEESKKKDENPQDEKIQKNNGQKLFYRNSLATANSRPLLIKRVLSAKKL